MANPGDSHGTLRRPIIASPDAVQQSVLANLDARARQRGQMSFPCVPAALDHYVDRLTAHFALLGKSLSADERNQLRDSLRGPLEEGFARAAGSRLLVEYELSSSQSLKRNLACRVSASVASVADEYKGWTSQRGDAMFGRHADARVNAAAEKLDETHRVLDVGAGTGRNALPLSRRGIRVDAVELTPEFADRLDTLASAEQLPLRVLQGDVLDRALPLESSCYDLVVVSEVVSHFRNQDQLRRLLERLSEVVVPGGQLLFNLFLADEGCQLDPLARDVSQVAWSYIYTRDELDEAFSQLPWQRLADESVVEYEHAHLAPEAWPPTGWFVTWATGRAVVPVNQGYPPFELRWILCQRT